MNNMELGRRCVYGVFHKGFHKWIIIKDQNYVFYNEVFLEINFILALLLNFDNPF